MTTPPPAWIFDDDGAPGKRFKPLATWRNVDVWAADADGDLEILRADEFVALLPLEVMAELLRRHGYEVRRG